MCFRWVEQDPKEILSSVYHCMEQTLNSCKDLKIDPAKIKGRWATFMHQNNESFWYCLLLNLEWERWHFANHPHLEVIFWHKMLFVSTAVGITNQRETTVVWDKLTGEPLHNAISNVLLLSEYKLIWCSFKILLGSW